MGNINVNDVNSLIDVSDNVGTLDVSVAETGKTQIGNRAITKKMFGTREVTKEVVNGVVVYEKSGSQLITFSIDNVSYQAESGMTWTQWVDSAYNTGGFIIFSDMVTTDYSSSVAYTNYTSVTPIETIQDNYDYVIAGGN